MAYVSKLDDTQVDKSSPEIASYHICRHFSSQGSYCGWALSWAEFLVNECRLCMALIWSTSTCWWSVAAQTKSKLPCVLQLQLCLVVFVILKFTVYGGKQTSVASYTHMHNAVSLVWSWLRLTPIKKTIIQMWPHVLHTMYVLCFSSHHHGNRFIFFHYWGSCRVFFFILLADSSLCSCMRPLPITCCAAPRLTFNY